MNLKCYFDHHDWVIDHSAPMNRGRDVLTAECTRCRRRRVMSEEPTR